MYTYYVFIKQYIYFFNKQFGLVDPHYISIIVNNKNIIFQLFFLILNKGVSLHKN